MGGRWYKVTFEAIGDPTIVQRQRDLCPNCMGSFYVWLAQAETDGKSP
jgi:ribosomal protein S27AE